jgi:hypothetical protein
MTRGAAGMRAGAAFYRDRRAISKLGGAAQMAGCLGTPATGSYRKQFLCCFSYLQHLGCFFEKQLLNCFQSHGEPP